MLAPYPYLCNGAAAVAAEIAKVRSERNELMSLSKAPETDASGHTSERSIARENAVKSLTPVGDLRYFCSTKAVAWSLLRKKNLIASIKDKNVALYSID